MNFKDLLKRAKQGDNEAIEILLDMYKPLITRYSFFNNAFDEDLYQEQLLRFIHCIKKFSLDFPEECNEVTHNKRD